jgi:hypothetical protein
MGIIISTVKIRSLLQASMVKRVLIKRSCTTKTVRILISSTRKASYITESTGSIIIKLIGKAQILHNYRRCAIYRE